MMMKTPAWLANRRISYKELTTSRYTSDNYIHGLTRDVAFNRHSMNDGHHVSPTDNGEVQIGTDNIRVALAQGINEDQFKKTLSAAVRATVGLDMTQALPGEWEPCASAQAVHDRNKAAYRADKNAGMESVVCDVHDEHDYDASMTAHGGAAQGRVAINDWEEMLKGGLQTALETQTIVFAVSGVSRTATHQLVRSRRGAFHQQSQRAGYMGDMPECRMPESVWVNPVARGAFLHSVMTAWNAYRMICDEDISYQDARFVLPEGTTNFILLEYPVREFLNVYAYRACSMFQWEIVQVMRQCREVLIEAHPWLEPYVKISCEKTGPARIPINDQAAVQALHKAAKSDNPRDAVEQVMLGMPGFSNPSIKSEYAQPDSATAEVQHHCTFQGWEDVEGQCDFSWAKHEARTFKPEHHRITREGKVS